MAINRNLSILAQGAGSANNLSLGGATLGSNALAVTGTTAISGNVTIGGTNNVATGTISIGVANNAAVLVDGRLDANGNTYGYRFVNGSAGTAATTLAVLGNGTNALQQTMFGTAWTTSGIYRQGGALLTADGPGGLTLATGAAQPIYFGINSVEKMRLDTSGNLGIGGTPANQVLNVFATSTGTTSTSPCGIRIYDNGYSNSVQVCSRNGQAQYNANSHVFLEADVEKARIGSDGSLLVGTTTNSGAGVVRATGGFKTVTGSTSIVGGGPTTIFSMPAGGLYFVYAESAGGSTGYGCSAACVSVPYSSGVLRLAEGTTNNYISVSGANVQVTTSLGTGTYNWSYIFIPST